MVHDIHPLLYRRDFCGRGGDGGRAVDGAGGEERGGYVEGGFPEVGEFVEDVGDAGGGSAVVEEDYEALGGGDHFLEGWPDGRGGRGGVWWWWWCCKRRCGWGGVPTPAGRGWRDGIGGWDVCVFQDSAPDEDLLKGADVEVVAVGEKQGEDLVGVFVEPLPNGDKVAFQGTGVVFGAGGVTHTELFGDGSAVSLRLEKSDAGVELHRHVDILIVGGHDAVEGGVVGADLGEIVVGPRTVFGVSIAAGGIVGQLGGDVVDHGIERCGKAEAGSDDKIYT